MVIVKPRIFQVDLILNFPRGETDARRLRRGILNVPRCEYKRESGKTDPKVWAKSNATR